MRFRPCIDLHEGKVKQIVGASLAADGSAATNFVSAKPPACYADLYYRDGLDGGHVIQLGPGNDSAAHGALAAHPGFMQLGGGVTDENAREWLEAGASAVIVTSWLFVEGEFVMERLRRLAQQIGRERLVVDLSCRPLPDGSYAVACDRWRRLTKLRIDPPTMAEIAQYCGEFLVHAVAVEGCQRGIDRRLVEVLAQSSPVVVTYAGGIHSMADIAEIAEVGRGNIDFTVGSALDLFGGKGLRYDEVRLFNGRTE